MGLPGVMITTHIKMSVLIAVLFTQVFMACAIRTWDFF